MKIKPFFGILFVSILAYHCKAPVYIYQSAPPEIQVSDSSKSIVVIDAAEVTPGGLILNKKRIEVLGDVKNDYLFQLPGIISLSIPFEAKLDTTLSFAEKEKLLLNDRATTAAIYRKHNAGVIVILKDCRGGFSQDEVVKERNMDGSNSKTAYYSVYFQTDWKILQDNLVYEKTVEAIKPHSSRSVVSGLLSRGPAYKANKEDMAAVARENGFNFTLLFKERQVRIKK